jgi:signal transduction histidine kinase
VVLDIEPPLTWPARLARTAAAAAAGVALGVAAIELTQLEWIMIGVALCVGVGAAFLRLGLPEVAVASTVSVAAATVWGQRSWSSPDEGFYFGVIFIGSLLAAMLVVTAIRVRQEYVRRGWDLAFAEAREHDARVEQVVAREREAMAGEIHDGLGHRLTLIAVQAAGLSLDEQLPERVRAELRHIRENAAAASDELGETVRLLAETASGAAASPSGHDIEEVVEHARAAGVVVRSAVASGVDAAVNEYTRAALLRALREGLTNAAKHAPGAAVDVAIAVDGDEVVLEVRNALSGPRPPAASTGRGLVGLRHRAAILGGALEVEQEGDFALTVRLPCAAVPSPAAADRPPSRLGALTEESAIAARRRRRATRLAWLVPFGIAAFLSLATAGMFVVSGIASVLSPERFATVDVGDDQSETELLLPVMEMLEAPLDAVVEPPGADCRYYESSVSFFEREDVYMVCFADGRVVATVTVPGS